MADRRLGIFGALVAVAFTAGAALHWYQSDSSPGESRAFVAEGGGPGPSPASDRQVHAAFQRAVGLLHTKHFAPAAEAWEAVLELAPAMPEAHTNLGFSLIGTEDWARARASFERALELQPEQENAYYGLALCHEREGDLDLALGAMRVFVHLASPDSPHVRRALAAIWEWDAARNRATTPGNAGNASGASAVGG